MIRGTVQVVGRLEVNNEIMSGIFVECDEHELAQMNRLLLYKRVEIELVNDNK